MDRTGLVSPHHRATAEPLRLSLFDSLPSELSMVPDGLTLELHSSCKLPWNCSFLDSFLSDSQMEAASSGQPSRTESAQAWKLSQDLQVEAQNRLTRSAHIVWKVKAQDKIGRFNLV